MSGPKKGAICGSHKTVVPNCVNVWFYCVTSLPGAVQLVSSRSGNGRRHCFSAARSMLCVLLGFFRCKEAISLRLLCGSGDVACKLLNVAGAPDTLDPRSSCAADAGAECCWRDLLRNR